MAKRLVTMKDIRTHPIVVHTITSHYTKHRELQVIDDRLSSPLMFDKCSDFCKDVLDRLNETIRDLAFVMGEGVWNSNAVSMEFAKTWLYKFPGKKDFPRYKHNWIKVMRGEEQVGTIDLTYCQFISSAWHYDMCFFDWSKFYEDGDSTEIMPNDPDFTADGIYASF